MPKFFRAITKPFEKVTKHVVPNFIRQPIKQVAKIAPQAIGTVGGTMVGGPLGGMIGGGLGRATRHHGHRGKFSGFGKGALHGAIYAAAAPFAHQFLGGIPSSSLLGGIPSSSLLGGIPSSSLLSQMSGLNSPSLLSQLGISSAPSIGGGLGLFGNAGQAGLFTKALHAIREIPSPFGNLVGGDNGVANLALNRIKQKKSQMRGSGRTYPEYEEFTTEQNPYVVPGKPFDAEPESSSDKRISSIMANSSSSALEKLLEIIKLIEEKEQSNQPSQVKEFSHGGYVHGDSGGQDDDVPTDIPDGSYVMDATTVSLAGDGNSYAGARKMNQLEDKFLKRNIILSPKGQHEERVIKSVVSPGEYIIRKEVVDAAGGGSNEKGARVLDKFRKKLRQQKGVSKILPPKTKPIDRYI